MPDDNIGEGMAVNSDGVVFVTGWTDSSTFPVSPGAYDQAGSNDAFLTAFKKVSPPPDFEESTVTQDPGHPHAVSAILNPDGSSDTYAYDSAGSMTVRVEDQVTYDQTFNAVGILAVLTNTSTSQTWTFTYDGDGNRVKQLNPDGTVRLYLAGGLYEVDLSAGGQETGVKRYYSIAGQRIALRDSSGTYYVLTDQLGSVVGVLSSAGSLVAQQRYKPWGEPRLDGSGSPTDYGFTGQRELSGTGLQDFNARWLGQSLGAFASPDSLIANPFKPQSLNHYAYVLNNPLRYTDPTGLYVFEEAPSDKYVSVSDPRVRYATKTPGSKSLAPAAKPATASPSAPGATGGVQEGTGATAPQAAPTADLTTGPAVPPPTLDDITAARIASEFAYIFDVAGLVLSTVEAMVVDVTGAYVITEGCAGGGLAGPGGATIGCAGAGAIALALDIYISGNSRLGQLENGSALIALVATAYSDYRLNNTIPGERVGKDTLFSLRNAFLGLIPESNVDLVVSLSQINYDSYRRAGLAPGGYIELPSIQEVNEVLRQKVLGGWR